jgi:hypothetical protein
MGNIIAFCALFLLFSNFFFFRKKSLTPKTLFLSTIVHKTPFKAPFVNAQTTQIGETLKPAQPPNSP